MAQKLRLMLVKHIGWRLAMMPGSLEMNLP